MQNTEKSLGRLFLLMDGNKIILRSVRNRNELEEFYGKRAQS